ncbi:MAG: acryloyl-CoA reductase [Actinomycetes bacterium]
MGVRMLGVMRAFTITKTDTDPILQVEDLNPALLEGDVLVNVAAAGVNFKDSMVTQAGNRVARISPLVGGVDLAGEVVESPEGGPAVGSLVIAHGYGIGVAHHGGFAEMARIPHSWVVPLPEGLTPKAAMAYGTAGFTAMASILALEASGLVAGAGPVLVTGAVGGVGSTAVALLAARGYEVVASTGRAGERQFLENLGAHSVIGRDEIDDNVGRPLASERWAGAVDCVGGATLSAIIRSLRYGATVAASGLTGGTEFHSTVFPFIVRGVRLVGIDSVEMPISERTAVWEALAASPFTSRVHEIIDREVGLDGVAGALADIAGGKVRGRILVTPSS